MTYIWTTFIFKVAFKTHSVETVFGQEHSFFKCPCENFAWWHDNQLQPSILEAPKGKSYFPGDQTSRFGSDYDFSVSVLVHIFTYFARFGPLCVNLGKYLSISMNQELDVK